MQNDQTTRKKVAKGVIRIGKTGLSLAARMLIELIEQQEDLSYLYFHRVSDGRSVREARYEHERYLDYCEERQHKQAIKRLRERKLIKLRKEGERVTMKLTRDGRIQALQTIIRSSMEYFIDGKICLISYDFPEAASVVRDDFRRYLKRIGFTYVQGSVWSINKDVSVPIRELIKLLKIERWVKIYIVVK